MPHLAPAGKPSIALLLAGSPIHRSRAIRKSASREYTLLLETTNRVRAFSRCVHSFQQAARRTMLFVYHTTSLQPWQPFLNNQSSPFIVANGSDCARGPGLPQWENLFCSVQLMEAEERRTGPFDFAARLRTDVPLLFMPRWLQRFATAHAQPVRREWHCWRRAR